MNQSPNHIILHRGTNSLPKEENPESIAENIITAKKVKTKTMPTVTPIISAYVSWSWGTVAKENRKKKSD